MVCGRIDEGHFNETKLDGLNWALLLYWPGEIADGNGTQQVIIDERANPAQREGLRRILHGESTTPGATHFFVYNSTMSTMAHCCARSGRCARQDPHRWRSARTGSFRRRR
jgi:hypothetical protein